MLLIENVGTKFQIQTTVRSIKVLICVVAVMCTLDAGRVGARLDLGILCNWVNISSVLTLGACKFTEL